MGVRVPPSALHILAGQNPQRLKHDRVLESSDSHANSHEPAFLYRTPRQTKYPHGKILSYPLLRVDDIRIAQAWPQWPSAPVDLVTPVAEHKHLTSFSLASVRPLKRLDMTTPQLHTITDIGKILNVSRSTVYRLIDRGDILVINVGGCKRITETSLRNFIKDRERAAKLGLS